jgi:tetratricopeptide (TPR) repeat protein
VFQSAVCQDQVKLDSLQAQLKNAKEDSARISILLAISLQFSSHDYSKAADFAQRANEIAIRQNLPTQIALTDRALAKIFMEIGDYKVASSHYFKALKFYETLRDTFGILAVSNNLGTICDRLHEYDKALEYYFIARDLLAKIHGSKVNTFSSATIYNNIANIYQTKADFKSALQYYEKALSLAQTGNNKYMQGIVYNNLGKLYLNNLKQLDKAFQFISKGLALRTELLDKGEMAKSYTILADYYYQTGNYAKAHECVDQAIALGKQVGSLESQKYAYQKLSEIESEVGKPAEALTAFKNFKLLNDSIQNNFANNEIAKLQLQYDFEKATKAREQEHKESRMRYLIAIVLLAAGLILAILITILIRTRARQTELKRKNLAQDVETKNKELTTNVMYLIRKNELINNVAERLLSLQQSFPADNQKTIHEIVLDLQKEADNDSWKEFELRFNQVHSEFYKNLRKQNPDLSPAEEKLCAFLRLNMSSKEIAAITQQSSKSVEVARARLRKKLNLTNTNSNLVTYLSNL